MSTQNVSITAFGFNDRVLVRAPYNSEFTKWARSRGAKWDAGSKGWLFDSRDLQLVKDRCMADFGHDGERRDQVDVRVTISEHARGYQGPISIYGRSIARASGRDSGAVLCEGIAVETGGFTSGGSMKNWVTKPKGDTTVIIRDWSRDSANALLTSDDSDYSMVEIIEPLPPVLTTMQDFDRALADIERGPALAPDAAMAATEADFDRTIANMCATEDARVDSIISDTMREAVSTAMLERLAWAVVNGGTTSEMRDAVNALENCLKNRAALLSAMS